jgi:hypothetical protein
MVIIMQVKEIAITRIFNTGNYENVRYEVRVALDNIEDPATSIRNAEKLITDYWQNRNGGKTIERY